MIPNHSIGRKGRSFVYQCCLLCLSMFAMLLSPLHAQTAGAGTIKGTITDSSQAVSPEQLSYRHRTSIPGLPTSYTDERMPAFMLRRFCSPGTTR